MMHYPYSCNYALKVFIVQRIFFCKMYLYKLQVYFPYVFTFNLNAGFNHINFTLGFFFSEVSKSVVSLKPLLLSASECVGIELLKTFSSDEM